MPCFVGRKFLRLSMLVFIPFGLRCADAADPFAAEIAKDGCGVIERHYHALGEPAQGGANDYIVVSLTGVQINRVTRPDTFSKEEGVITIQMGPKKTRADFFWSGEAKKKLNYTYSNAIVFAGKEVDLKDRLDYVLYVNENDDKDEEKLKKVANVVKDVGGAVSPIPYGAPIAAGMDLLSAILNAVAGSYKSTTELLDGGNLFSIGGTNNVKVGQYTVFFKSPRCEDPDIRVNLSVARYPSLPHPNKSSKFRSFDIKKTGVIAILREFEVDCKHDLFSKSHPKEAKKQGIAAKLKKYGKQTATLEVKIAEASFSLEFYPNAFSDKRFQLKDVEIYRGKWMESGLPTSVSLSYTEAFADLSSVSKSAFGLAKSIIPGSVPPDIGTSVDIVQTASSSILANLALKEPRTLCSAASTLLRNEENDIIFTMYSGSNGRPLGYIRALIDVIPGFPLPPPSTKDSDGAASAK